MTAPVPLNVLGIESSSPKNALFAITYVGEQGALGESHISALDFDPLADGEAEIILDVCKRESSSPKNALLISSTMQVKCVEYSTLGLMHVGIDMVGNTVTDQKHRGGMSG